MSWHPNDLVTDTDLQAYEAGILDTFAKDDWQEKRQKALEDWLFPLLENTGFDPQRFRTRFVPTAVLSYTSSTYADRLSASQTDDGLAMATHLAASSDALYVGYDAPFRGVSIRVLDSPNATTATATWQVWADTWESPVGIVDGTKVGTVPLARGGAVTWRVPEGVVARPVNSSADLYWARLKLSAAPTSTLIGPLSVIRRSRLSAAVTFRTLATIFREAPAAQDGPWDAKATWYEQEAERAWLRAVGYIGGEFDTDGSDAVSTTEAGQTAADVSGGGWRLERA